MNPTSTKVALIAMAFVSVTGCSSGPQLKRIPASAHAHAEALPNMQPLYDLAMNAVIEDTLDTDGLLFANIKSLNEDTTDGKNPQGCLPLPLEKNRLQTTLLSGQDFYGIDTSKDGTFHTMISGNILVTVHCEAANHKAVALSSLKVLVGVEQVTDITLGKDDAIIPGETHSKVNSLKVIQIVEDPGE